MHARTPSGIITRVKEPGPRDRHGKRPGGSRTGKSRITAAGCNENQVAPEISQGLSISCWPVKTILGLSTKSRPRRTRVLAVSLRFQSGPLAARPSEIRLWASATEHHRSAASRLQARGVHADLTPKLSTGWRWTPTASRPCPATCSALWLGQVSRISVLQTTIENDEVHWVGGCLGWEADTHRVVLGGRWKSLPSQ